MAISCCDIVAPIRLGDSVAVITLVAGEPDPVSGIVFTAEGCDCGYAATYENIYCDVTEGGLYPHASITDTSYELISLPAEHSLVIDAVEREVRLIETDTGTQVGGIDSLDFSGIFEWIEAAKGGCVRVCIDPTNATLNADTTVAVQRYDREL
jgi:hypothetical protein